MLRKVRVALALFFWVIITLLFLDFTGTVHAWFGWMAKIQFLPAVLALNVGVVLGLVVMTLLLGRVYCSVVCPLGVMQDFFAWLGRLGGKKRRNKYSYSPAISWLRYGVLALFVVALVAGVSAFVALLAPYSSYGRIVSGFLAPVYAWGNNQIAGYAESAGSYTFYQTEIYFRSVTAIVAAVTLVVLVVLSWRNGRTYCNTICPVGTVLGFLSRYSWLKPVIDTSKCNSCGLCGRRCKAACINTKEHVIDYSRCVSCMDCLDNCHQHAISYRHLRHVSEQKAEAPAEGNADSGRRAFMTGVGVIAASAAVKAQDKVVDGGLAVIEDKKIPARKTRIVPPGAVSLSHFSQHCTACQLCVSVCPTKVLRPSTDMKTFLQPESSYEIGYCRPECTKCSEVCPAGAIIRITESDKAATQIGHAVWVKENCVPLTDGVPCGNCARKCPVGAITMVAYDPSDPDSPKIPVVNDERCIGCGACENLCPSRPFSAIYVEGHEVHREV